MTTLPQKPTAPTCFDKAPDARTDQEWSEISAYLSEVEAWGKQCLEGISQFNTYQVWEMLGKSEDALLAWMHKAGAPAEVVSLFRMMTDAKFSYASGDWRKTTLGAARVVDLMQSARPMIKEIRKATKTTMPAKTLYMASWQSFRPRSVAALEKAKGGDLADLNALITESGVMAEEYVSHVTYLLGERKKLVK